jgi:hypothetical protein
MRKEPRPPWKRPAPPKASRSDTSLTPSQIAAARRRAEEAGRRYPNLVDNMWAKSQPRGDTPQS